METSQFEEKATAIANAVKGMPYWQWKNIVHSVEKIYNSEFSKEQSHHILENPESILLDLKMFFN